jgi:hypothetical protein
MSVQMFARGSDHLCMPSTAAAAAAVTRVVPLAAARRRTAPETRVAYELARLRTAATREPAPRFAHLAQGHD